MGAISFTKKNYTDTATSGSGITASDMNKIENAIVDIDAYISTSSGKNGSVSYFKAAGIVIVSCKYVKVTIHSAWGSATIGTLPTGFRPSDTVIAPIASDWASGSMIVETDGTVKIVANDKQITTAASISSIAVFPAA